MKESKVQYVVINLYKQGYISKNDAAEILASLRFKMEAERTLADIAEHLELEANALLD